MTTTLITIAAIVAGFLVLFVSLWVFVSKNYLKVAPNEALILYGKGNKSADGKSKKGYRLITGGGAFKIPFFEEKAIMDLSTRVINIDVQSAPNRDGVMTTVQGVANVKISSTPEMLETAVERFLKKSDESINNIIYQNLEGHLRSVVGKMSIEQLIGDKQALNKAVLEDATEDFHKMGVEIDSLNIQNVKDNLGYIENLGKKRVAEIKKDAEIGTANAGRDSLIQTTTANKEGIQRKNENEMEIAQSDRNREVKKAEMQAEIDKQQATAAQAGPLANARALKDVVEAEALTKAANETANINVEQQKAKREEQRLNAEMVIPAEAAKLKAIIDATASQQRVVIDAEGKKQASIIEATGKSEAILLEANAQAQADAIKIEKKGIAEGKAIEARLMAEATGIAAKADAYAKLDQTGKFLEVLNSLQTLAPNVVKEFAGVMAASTAHLANVKDIHITDFGGNGGGASSTSKFGSVPVEIITKFVEGFKSTGMDVNGLLNLIGMKQEGPKAISESPNSDSK